MSKRLILVLILILIILGISVSFFFNNNRNDKIHELALNKEVAFERLSNFIDLSNLSYQQKSVCNTSGKEIIEFIDNFNNCNVSGDCMAVAAGPCGGCYAFVNFATNVSLIADKRKIYLSNNCPVCPYECGPVINTLKMVKCEDHKCII